MIYTNFFTREEILAINILLTCQYKNLVVCHKGEKIVTLDSINGKPLTGGVKAIQILFEFSDVNSFFQFAQDLRERGIYHKRSFMLNTEFWKN